MVRRKELVETPSLIEALIYPSFGKKLMLVNLSDLASVLSSAMKYVPEVSDEVAGTVDVRRLDEFARAITQARTLAEQVGRELGYLEFVVACRQNEIDDLP